MIIWSLVFDEFDVFFDKKYVQKGWYTTKNDYIIVDIQWLTVQSHIINFYIFIIMKKYIQNGKKIN